MSHDVAVNWWCREQTWLKFHEAAAAAVVGWLDARRSRRKTDPSHNAIIMPKWMMQAARGYMY